MSIDLDFVDKKSFAISQVSIGAFFIFLAGCIFSMFVLKEYQSLTEEYARVTLNLNQNVLQALKKEERDKENENVGTVSEEELKKIRQTISDLSTPWDPLLNSLEQIQIPDIALLILEPNKKKQQITLTGQAKNIQVMLNYVEALSSIKMLSNVYLQNHMIDVSDPNKPVSFKIVAQWK